ncbi:hypothetical protein ACFSQZ_11595 [Rubritalea spongiae]|uniref:Uncharacterized protein n=2 Tax=Rubritalea spongiae TaxID=430797 RepID=A0ABW5E3C7_9BACT
MKKEQKKLYREKLEELGHLIGESLEWISDLSSVQNLMDLADLSICPEVRKAVVVSNIYFPELSRSVHEYNNQLIALHNFYVDTFIVDRESPAGADASRHPQHAEILGKTMQHRQAVDDEICKVAAKIVRA